LTSSTTSTTTASTIRPSQTTASLDDWQPIFRGSLGQGFGDWIGGVNNRFPVSYADVQPEFLIPVQAENQTRFLQAKSSSQPDENYQKNAERFLNLCPLSMRFEPETPLLVKKLQLDGRVSGCSPPLTPQKR